MIELSQHIENLLLENDCVVIPRLGGFVAYCQPAVYVEKDSLFLPPTRVVGFNPQLKMNDGLLVQSFMSVYGTSFSDANKMVDQKVDKLLELLHENGQVDLPQIGELRYSIYEKISFIAYDNKLTTPTLYGLGSFEMPMLKSAIKPAVTHIADTPEAKAEDDKTTQSEGPIKLQTHYRKLHIGPAWTAALAAVVVLAFLYIYQFDKVPTTSTVQYTTERAQLIPTEKLMEAVVEKVDKPAIEETLQVEEPIQQEPIRKELSTFASKELVVSNKAEETQSIEPSNAQEQILAQPSKKYYHVIVASVATESEVNKLVNRLKSQGHADAKAIIGGGKMRVCIASYATRDEASIAASQHQDTYQGAWVLKKVI